MSRARASASRGRGPDGVGWRALSLVRRRVCAVTCVGPGSPSEPEWQTVSLCQSVISPVLQLQHELAGAVASARGYGRASPTRQHGRVGKCERDRARWDYDGMALLRKMYPADLEWIVGGQCCRVARGPRDARAGAPWRAAAQAILRCCPVRARAPLCPRTTRALSRHLTRRPHWPCCCALSSTLSLLSRSLSVYRVHAKKEPKPTIWPPSQRGAKASTHAKKREAG